ncbi:MAG: hypothetical protein JW969_02130 [Spirochaetales bacterium]|nr:hypothetical protein [Spirochaetales bacterium]
MKKIIILLFCLLLICSWVTAQQTDDDNGEDSLFTFDLNMAPNTDGAMEGNIELGLLWSPWLYSSVEFSLSSSTAVYDEAGGSTTAVDSTKNLDITALRTRENFLKWNFAGNDFYAALNARVLLNIKWINQEKYGYINIPAFSVFYENQDVFNLYPYAGGDLELKLGPLMIKGYYLTSIMILYTDIKGEFYYSALPALTSFSYQDEGFEFRTGGTAVYTPVPALEIKYGFDLLRHIGYTYGYTGGSGTKYVYEGIEMKHSLSLRIDIKGYKPVIGASYTMYSFKPVSLFSVERFSVDRWGFLFGMEL